MIIRVLRRSEFSWFIWLLLGLLVALLIFPVAVRATSVQLNAPIQLVQQGKKLYDRSQYINAAEKWQQAVEIYERQGNQLQQAQTLTYLSLAEQKLAQWTKATKTIAKSKQLLKSLKLETADSKMILAQTLNAQGAIALSLGKFESALKFWQQATQKYQQISDSSGVTGSLINQAQALERLGFYRRTCKTLLQATQNEYSCDFSSPQDWQSVLKGFEILADKKLQILGLRNLGDILRQLGDEEHSQQVLNRSLQIDQSAEEKSKTLISLGLLNKAKYRKAHNLYNKTYLPRIKDEAKQKALNVADAAIDNYQRAIEILDNSAAQDIITQAQLHQLTILVDLYQWSKNQNFNLSALDSQINQLVTVLNHSQIFQQAPSYFAIQAQLNFARNLTEIKSQQQLAIGYIERAYGQAKKIADWRSQSSALGILGYFYEKQKNWSEAEKQSQLALNISQTIHAKDLNAQWRSQLGRIYQTQNKFTQAKIAYQGAIGDFNVLKQDLVSISSETQVSWQQDREAIYRNFIEVMMSDSSKNRLSQSDLHQTIEIIDSLKIAEVENFLNCNLINRDRLQGPEIDPSAAYIFPIILKNKLKLIVGLPHSKRLESYTISISHQELEQALTQWRTELEKRFISPKSLLLSQKIYGWLLKPLESALVKAEVKTLVFILDGGFRNLPMSALYDGQKYLIEKQYAIATLPSLKLLSPKSITEKELDVLAFGLSETRSDFIAHQGFEALENIKTELIEISSKVTTKKYLNREFTSKNLQQKISSLDFPILHLATHGQFSSDIAKTFLLAWDKRIDVGNLSNLLKQRVQNNIQPIELLVLSACQTAVGDNQAIIGLAGIGIESGAKSTLASLWNVKDVSTTKLMSQFYQELSKNNSKAESLRRSQVNLLHTPGYQAPFYWSPYILSGSWL